MKVINNNGGRDAQCRVSTTGNAQCFGIAARNNNGGRGVLHTPSISAEYGGRMQYAPTTGDAQCFGIAAHNNKRGNATGQFFLTIPLIYY